MINFELLTDIELDKLIGELIELSPEERTVTSEEMGRGASTEWTSRYPDTISPSVYSLAMERGGFPSCYTGPQRTVELNTIIDDKGSY
jgi:hypothetical protein